MASVERDEHQDHPAAVGAQQREQLAAACACGRARRAGSPSSAPHRPATSRSTACGSGTPGPAARARRSRGRARSPRAARSWVPRAATRPSSSTTISSASEMVERRWAITNVVRPSITSRSASLIRLSVVASTLEVASSRIRMRGLGEQRAGDRHALALAAATASGRARRPASRSPSGSASTNSARPGPLGGLADLLVARVGARVGDVLAQRGREQEGVVGHQRDLAPQRLRGRRRARRRRRSAPRPRPRRRGAARASTSVVLPEPVAPTSATVSPGLDLEVDVAQHGLAALLVGERHVAQLHPPAARRQRRRVRRARSARGRGRGSRTRARRRPPRAGPCRAITPSMRIGRGEHHHVAVEGDELADRDRAR